MHRFTVAVATSSLLLFIVGLIQYSVYAFFPTNLTTVSGFGMSHMRITEDAIKALDAEFFRITKLTKPMRKASKQIADANAKVDDDQILSEKHFDGENFPGGQNRLIKLLGEIQTSLDSNNAEGARTKLGEALHTIQDFYSHSNWVLG